MYTLYSPKLLKSISFVFQWFMVRELSLNGRLSTDDFYNSYGLTVVIDLTVVTGTEVTIFLS